MSMLPEQIELISMLNAHSVEYLVVGGHAVSEYSEPRATKDLDLFIRNDPENSKGVFRTLAAFGAPLAGFRPSDFRTVPFTTSPLLLTGLMSFNSLTVSTFDTAWQHRVHLTVGEQAVPATFISLNDLIVNKLAAGRLRDLADVEALRAAEAARGKS